ncbi:ATP-binding protein [Candidatus Binatia bacterium]|nr:ATP-binding protein [Candidatus Binatia bacterium]
MGALHRRLRLVAWVMFVVAVLFAAAEAAAAPTLGWPLVVKVCSLSVVAATLAALRKLRPTPVVRWAALALICGGYVVTALSGALSPSGEYFTSATLFAAAALATSALLPWGPYLQAASVFVGAASLTVAALWRGFDPLLALTEPAQSDPVVAVLLTFALSVVVAYEMERAQRQRLHHLDLRRRAEAQVRKLNAYLERMVVERTVQLVEANRQLETEVDKRQATADALVQSQRQLLGIVDHSTTLVTLKDLEGRYLLVNREFERVFGMDRQSVLGQTDRAVFGAEIGQTVRARDEFVMAVDGPLSFDEDVVTPLGQRSFVSVRFPLRDAAGAQYGLGTIATDITGLRQVQEGLRRQQDEVAQRQRLNTVGELAAAVGHEFHQPLGAIASFAQGCIRRLATHPEDLDPVIDALEQIVSETMRAGEILRGLRRRVRRSDGPREAVDLVQVVNHAVCVLDPQVRLHRVELHVLVASEIPRVEADRAQLEQVLVNILQNGIEATAGLPDGARTVKIEIAPAPGAVEVSVTDTGLGIASEIAETIFEPFVTTRPAALGMGLAISRSIVDSHGGRMWATSRPGRGARISFRLPTLAAIDAAEQVRSAETPPPSPLPQ